MFRMKQKSGFVILIVALAFTGGTRLVAAMDGTKPVPPGVYAVHGTGAEKPKGYVPVMLSNGSLCITVDFSGGVSAPKKERHRGLSNGIFIQGRRMGGRDYALYGHGWYRPTLKVDGKERAVPDRWSQSFDPSAAKTAVVGEFGGIERTIETFVAHDEDIIAIRQTFSSDGTEPVPPLEAGIEYFEPKHERIQGQWEELPDGRAFSYKAFGKNIDNGRITIRNAMEGGAFVTFISFGKPYRGTYAALAQRHASAWAKYYSASEVNVPDAEIMSMRRSAEYQLKCNVTKWSIPVGLLPSHFQGGFFAFDEMYAVQGLLSAGHFDEARRASDYRFRTLGVSRGRLGGAGARWVWVSIEDPNVEWSPLGFYLDHIFHISAIARTCALNALYADDAKYLRERAYPVMRECARFYAIHCVYDAPDGSSFVCKCTDLERLGVAKERPFMTTCGVIDTLRLAADAAKRLGIDAKDAKKWRRIAARLEKSLPVKDGRFAAAANAVDTVSMGVMAGYFPFPIFPKGHKVQTASVDWFLSHGVKAGNMYATGKKICPWYAAAMAMGAMRAGEGEKVLPLLREASASAGVWGEYWEINEPGVAECRPWFMTAAGNCLYAINSMLLMEADGECRIGAGVPKEWKDWSFRLPAESGYEVDFAMKGGVVTKLVLRQQPYNKRGADPRSVKVILPDGARRTMAVQTPLVEWSRSGGVTESMVNCSPCDN